MVRCPWHAREFDIRTGRSEFDSRRVKTRANPAQVARNAALAAESVAVTVEGRYLAVEL